MATRTPPLQERSQFHRNWGNFASRAAVPNGPSSPLGALVLSLLEAGDLAFAEDVQALYQCRDAGSAGLGDAVWAQAASSGLSYVVSSKDDFPAPVAGVITLPSGTSWMLTNDVDLQGDRIECAGPVNIHGTSSETSTLRSTGLVGTPLITTQYSIPMRDISITADVAVLIDGSLALTPPAVDWISVNFVDCATIGLLRNISNWTTISCAFLNSGTLQVDGIIGTFGSIQSIFDAAPGSTIIQVLPTAVIERRIRFIACAYLALPGETSFDVSVLATVPVEGYVLLDCNFSGGGSHTVGVQYDDNKARFEGCRGINNSASITQYYMLANGVPTPIGAINTFVKVAGVTLNGPFIERFVNGDNIATYAGALTGFFRVTATLSFTSGTNNQIRAAVYKNGFILPESEIISTANSGGRSENIVLQAIVQFDGGAGDYVEIFVANASAVANITVSELSVIVERLN